MNRIPPLEQLDTSNHLLLKNKARQVLIPDQEESSESEKKMVKGAKWLSKEGYSK